MTRASSDHEREFLRLHTEALDLDREMREMHERERRHEVLIARLRSEAGVREHDLAELRDRLRAAEHELEDLRAIRDALTPPELPERPGVDLAAAFLPAAERVSGDFYLVAEGPQDSTVLVVGDVVGHGLAAARRAAFTRTTFAATAPYSDDPCRLLGWANVALTERAGPSTSRGHRSGSARTRGTWRAHGGLRPARECCSTPTGSPTLDGTRNSSAWTV